MGHLGSKDRELVALGASVASNCVPCIAFHVREAKAAGLTNNQLKEAIELAEKVKQVPANQVRNTAFAYIEGAGAGPDVGGDEGDLPRADRPCDCNE